MILNIVLGILIAWFIITIALPLLEAFVGIAWGVTHSVASAIWRR